MATVVNGAVAVLGFRCSAAGWPWTRPPPAIRLDVVESFNSNRGTSTSSLEEPLVRQKAVNPSKLLQENLQSRAGQCRENEEEGSQSVWLPSAPPVPKPRAVHNAAALAFMGDAIYEVFSFTIQLQTLLLGKCLIQSSFSLFLLLQFLKYSLFPDKEVQLYVRRHFLTPPQSMDKYNNRVMALVCCEAQHALLQKLLKDSFLSEEERDVLRWGKNVDAGHKRAKRRAGIAVYNSASSLETLIGYLYLTNQQRLSELMGQLGFVAEQPSRLDGFVT